MLSRLHASCVRRASLPRPSTLLFHTAAAFSSVANSSTDLPPPALNKVLIANRGEIACRVIRTCRRLGIPTVAIYSSADGRDALHARMADECVQIGTGPSPTESYLRQDDVIEIAQQMGADAVHPGYGFLSENADFSQALDEAGVTWIGPPASAITAMGSKSQSKAIMEEAGVPTTPGYYGDDTQEADFLLAKAVHEIGFPLLIKAVSGGGGKGMRLVHAESEFVAALDSCRREAQAAFGDDRVLLEKYLVNPRHVEVQVLADTHGNALYLHERDCSLQRRHQKIIEEAPASDLPLDLRQRLGQAGTRAAQAVGYVNAGTVEFLLDTQTTRSADEDPQFYFCEMNTRLQVEHPITELITGLDLVEWQLRIAAGQELSLQQEDIASHGHAFEARVYAEKIVAGGDFLPATGTLWHHDPPVPINTGVSDSGIRVDAGVTAGQHVGVDYDPMISKLIVHDESRDKALQKLVAALKRYHVAGVATNIDFLVQCAIHPTFGRAGAVHTGFLDDHADDVFQAQEHVLPPPFAQAIGALATMLYLENRIGDTGEHPPPPWSSQCGSWRMGGASGRARRSLRLGKDVGAVECVSNRDGSFDVRVAKEEETEDEWIHVAGSLNSNHNMEVVVDGRRRVRLTTVLRNDGGILKVRMWPEGLPNNEFFWKVDFANPLEPAASLEGMAGTASGAGIVQAPMPGKIRRIHAAVGDAVKAGDTVIVMEAMKMEHAITAPRDGVVAELRFQTDDVVDDGAVLLVLDSNSDEDTSSNAA